MRACRLALLPLLACLAAPACSSQGLVRARPAEALFIRDARVLDVRTGTVHPGRDLLLRGPTIAEIRPTGAPAPAGVPVLEARGRTLIPGLVDAHIHLGSPAKAPWVQHLPDVELNLARLLYCGVTTVFDPGDLASDAFDRRQDVAEGELLGPRIFAAGPVFTAEGGHPIPMIRQNVPWYAAWYVVSGMTRQLSSPEQATEEVEALLEDRPDFIKMAIDRIPEDAPRLTPDIAAAVVRAARAGGVRAVAHIGALEDALDAARAGASAWIHLVYKEPLDDDALAELAAAELPMITTLAVFSSFGRLGREPRLATALERQIVPADELADFDRRPAGYQPPPSSMAMLDMLWKTEQLRLDNVRRLYEAGVPLIAGSDSQSTVYHGPGLHRELALLARAGLPPLAILQAATLRAAQFLEDREDPSFGHIAVGKRADLVLLESDPLADIAAVSNIAEVISAGRWLVRTPLQAQP